MNARIEDRCSIRRAGRVENAEAAGGKKVERLSHARFHSHRSSATYVSRSSRCRSIDWRLPHKIKYNSHNLRNNVAPQCRPGSWMQEVRLFGTRQLPYSRSPPCAQRWSGMTHLEVPRDVLPHDQKRPLQTSKCWPRWHKNHSSTPTHPSSPSTSRQTLPAINRPETTLPCLASPRPRPSSSGSIMAARLRVSILTCMRLVRTKWPP